MLTKEKVIALLNSLEENFSVDDLIEKLIIQQKIEDGNKDSINNNVITVEDLEKEMEKW